MSDIQFEEMAGSMNTRGFSSTNPKLVQLMIDWKVASDVPTANKILLGVAILFFIVTALIINFFLFDSSKEFNKDFTEYTEAEKAFIQPDVLKELEKKYHQ